MKRGIEKILRFGVWMALVVSWFHAFPILEQHQAGPSDHRFVYQPDYVPLFAVQSNTISEQKLPHKVSEGDVCGTAEADFFATIDLRFDVPRLFTSEILLTLTTSSYL